MRAGPSLLDFIPAFARPWRRRGCGSWQNAHPRIPPRAVERADASDPASTGMVTKGHTSGRFVCPHVSESIPQQWIWGQPREGPCP